MRTGERAEAERELQSRVMALVEGESDEIARMATIACELYHADPRFDWVGFYRRVEDELLKIGPYQGGHGCLVIPFDRGVCGACARTGPDGSLIAVLDIDSDQPDAFTAQDARFMESLMAEVFSR